MQSNQEVTFGHAVEIVASTPGNTASTGGQNVVHVDALRVNFGLHALDVEP